MKAYLAGPMSGIPQFNFPEFHRVTAILRMQGWEVVSPAEEDYKYGVGQIAEKSVDGDPNGLKETWGQILARDVIILADQGIEAIIFLPGWENSKGAKLEATVGLLTKKIKFYEWSEDDIAYPVDPCEIAAEVYMSHIESFTPETDIVH